MSAISFDTHKFVIRLRQAGLPEQQAEAIADAFKDAQSDAAPVTRDFFDARLKAEIEAAKSEIIKWNVGAILAAAGVALAVVRLSGHG